MNTNTTTKSGPTGLLAGRRSTPANTQEETRMSVIETTGVAVAAARATALHAVDQYRLGQLTDQQLTDTITDAQAQEDAAIAAVPAPACPDWCTLPVAHPYDTREDYDDPSQTVLSRWHKRTYYDTRHFELFVEAQERATTAGVVVDEPRVCTLGELERVDGQEACAVSRALLTAAGLLAKIGGAR